MLSEESLPQKRKSVESAPKRKPGRKKATFELEELSDSANEMIKELGFDDTLVGNDEDAKMLEEMKEIDRENIMANRHELLTQYIERRKLQRQQARQSMASYKTQNALTDIKKKREKSKSSYAEDSVSSISDGSSRSRSSSSSSISDSDSTLVKKENSLSLIHKSASQYPPMATVTMLDLERVRISREKLEKWVDQVFFEKTVVGCFVRLTLASGRENIPVTYQIKEIIDVKVDPDPAKEYMFGKKRINKYLILHAGKTIPVKMTYISNKEFTDEEFIIWLKTVERTNKGIIQQETIVAKEEAIKKATTYQYTNEEINQQVSLKIEERLEKKNRSNLVYQKNQLECQAMHYIELLRKDKRDALSRKRLEQTKLQIRKINELIEKAKSEDKLQDKSAELAKKTKILDTGGKTSLEKNKRKFDPFSRRQCKPQIMWHTDLTAQYETPELSRMASKISELDQNEHLPEKEAQYMELLDHREHSVKFHKATNLFVDQLTLEQLEETMGSIGKLPIRPTYFEPKKNKEEDSITKVLTLEEWLIRSNMKAENYQQIHRITYT